MPRKRRSFAGRKKPPAAPARESPAPEEEEEESVPETDAPAGAVESEPEESSVVSEEMPQNEEEEQTEDLPEAEVGDENGVEEVEEPPPEENSSLEIKDGEEETTEVEEPVAGTSASAASSPPGSSGAGSTPELGIEEQGDFISQLMTDKQYLFNVDLGYGPEQNLKHPLKGFTAEDEVQLFPVIETMSAKLFNIVQKMTACHKKDVEAAMKVRKGVLKIPNNLIKAYLCQLRFMEKPEQEATTSKRAPHPFLLQEDENIFSEEKYKMLRAVLDAGWKREVVMRSSSATGRKTGDVYYYNPEGVKFRSSKQVAQHLAELQDTPFTIDNFSFAKVRITSNQDQEIVRKAYDGKSPPRAPPKPLPSKAKPVPSNKPETSKPIAPRPSSSKDIMETESRSPSEEPIAAKGVAGRRSIQPPKRYSGDAVLLLSKRKMQDDKHRNSNSKGLMQMGMLPPKYPKGMEDTSSNSLEAMDYELGDQEASGGNSVAIKEIADDSLFAISALRQSGGIDVDSMSRYVASQKQLAQKAEGEGDHRRAAPGSTKRGESSVICSIRCPGMDGIVPNLQCTRCLCLFHAECLGLPPNLMFNKYICSNCTEQGTSASTIALPGTGFNQKNPGMKKPGEMVKRQPPGLAPIPHGGMRRPMPPVHRDLTVTLAGKEHVPVRLAQRPPMGGRGMMRGRGGMMHHGMRGHMVAPGQRMMAPDGHHVTVVSANQHAAMKRGRGRPPSVPPARTLPHISKNVSIQSLPRIHGPPPVPNLQPMGAPKPVPGKIQIPVMSKPRPGVPSVPNLMKSSVFRLTVPPPKLSGNTFKKLTPQPPHHPTNLRLNPATATMIPRPPAPVVHEAPKAIKRYPQSICTIGGKKYVVLPKKNRVNTEFVVSGMVSAVGNGGVGRGNYTIVDGIRNSETVVKRIETSVREQQETNNCNDSGLASQNATADLKEEQGEQAGMEDEGMENPAAPSDDAPDAMDGEDASMDGVQDGMDVDMNSNANDMIAANEAE